MKRLLGDERIRFLFIGAFNTAFGYTLFVAAELLFGHHIGYLASLFISYPIAVVVAFGLHRHFTFRVSGSGNVLLDFGRFVGVYAVALAANALALPALVEVAGLPPIVAQALVVVMTTLISYVGHKWFSFRRPKSAADPQAEES